MEVVEETLLNGMSKKGHTDEESLAETTHNNILTNKKMINGLTEPVVEMLNNANDGEEKEDGINCGTNFKDGRGKKTKEANRSLLKEKKILRDKMLNNDGDDGSSRKLKHVSDCNNHNNIKKVNSINGAINNNNKNLNVDINIYNTNNNISLISNVDSDVKINNVDKNIKNNSDNISNENINDNNNSQLALTGGGHILQSSPKMAPTNHPCHESRMTGLNMTGLNEMMNNSCTVCNVLHTVNNHSENEDDHILHSPPNVDKHVCNCPSNIDEHVHNCSSSNVNEHVQNCSPDDELTNISNDELKFVLKTELEHIFSIESFSKDKFLISQLDSDQYISLDIVVQLRRISQFTTDVKLIAQILEEFPNLQMDASGSKVRLIIPRSTIILRDVPQSTPKQAIEKLFDIDGSAPAVNCEYAGNQNWYINFASEQQARAAYHHLRQNVQTFLGQPIKARIKTSNTFLSSSSCLAACIQQQQQPSTNMATLITLTSPNHTYNPSAQHLNINNPASVFFQNVPHYPPEQVQPTHVWQSIHHSCYTGATPVDSSSGGYVFPVYYAPLQTTADRINNNGNASLLSTASVYEQQHRSCVNKHGRSTFHRSQQSSSCSSLASNHSSSNQQQHYYYYNNNRYNDNHSSSSEYNHQHQLHQQQRHPQQHHHHHHRYYGSYGDSKPPPRFLKQRQHQQQSFNNNNNNNDNNFSDYDYGYHDDDECDVPNRLVEIWNDCSNASQPSKSRNNNIKSDINFLPATTTKGQPLNNPTTATSQTLSTIGSCVPSSQQQQQNNQQPHLATTSKHNRNNYYNNSNNNNIDDDDGGRDGGRGGGRDGGNWKSSDSSSQKRNYDEDGEKKNNISITACTFHSRSRKIVDRRMEYNNSNMSVHRRNEPQRNNNNSSSGRNHRAEKNDSSLQRSPKCSKEPQANASTVPTFNLESNSFPPLPSTATKTMTTPFLNNDNNNNSSNSSSSVQFQTTISTSSTTPTTTTTTASNRIISKPPSYVQALNNCIHNKNNNTNDNNTKDNNNNNNNINNYPIDRDTLTLSNATIQGDTYLPKNNDNNNNNNNNDNNNINYNIKNSSNNNNKHKNTSAVVVVMKSARNVECSVNNKDDDDDDDEDGGGGGGSSGGDDSSVADNDESAGNDCEIEGNKEFAGQSRMSYAQMAQRFKDVSTAGSDSTKNSNTSNSRAAASSAGDSSHEDNKSREKDSSRKLMEASSSSIATHKRAANVQKNK